MEVVDASDADVVVILWFGVLGDVEVCNSLVTEATLVDAKLEVVDAPDADVVAILWSGVLGDVEASKSLDTEATLVDAMVEVVDALKSVTCETILVWEVVGNVLSRNKRDEHFNKFIKVLLN